MSISQLFLTIRFDNLMWIYRHNTDDIAITKCFMFNNFPNKGLFLFRYLLTQGQTIGSRGGRGAWGWGWGSEKEKVIRTNRRSILENLRFLETLKHYTFPAFWGEFTDILKGSIPIILLILNEVQLWITRLSSPLNWR